MLNYKKISIVAIIGFSLAVSSCKKYLNVNQSPNVTTSATTATLLSTSEVYVASAMGVDLEVNGSIWAQYWTQSPSASQYRTLEQYEPTSQTYETPWINLYTGAAENLVQLDSLAKSLNSKQYRAISFLLRAYVFQVITDGWGDVPFSQALKGSPQSGLLTSPVYDAQQSIYTGLLSYLDSANALINPNDATLPGTDDLIYGGNMAEWQKFSNTLRLKILLRLSEKNPTMAQTGIAALYATSPAFIGTGDDALVNFSSTSGNKNPLFSEEVGLGYTQNLIASNTCIDSMVSNGDMRVAVFYEPDNNGAYTGINQGTQPNILTVSIPSYNVAGDAQNSASALAPVKFITSYESYFLQAEAVARGWATTGNDDSLFIQGITASFNAYGAQLNAAGFDPAASLSTYLSAANWAQYPGTGSTAQKIQWIITQKWFSMCGNQGFEAWTEWRRTGYPNFFVISGSSLLAPNAFPRRFIYPYSEVTKNGNFPGLVPLTTPVYWDIH